eukprot:335917-Pyramimonas_sp.AAC.1
MTPDCQCGRANAHPVNSRSHYECNRAGAPESQSPDVIASRKAQSAADPNNSYVPRILKRLALRQRSPSRRAWRQIKRDMSHANKPADLGAGGLQVGRRRAKPGQEIPEAPKSAGLAPEASKS